MKNFVLLILATAAVFVLGGHPAAAQVFPGMPGLNPQQPHEPVPVGRIVHLRGVSSGLFLDHNVARNRVELAPYSNPGSGPYDGTRWRLVLE